MVTKELAKYAKNRITDETSKSEEVGLLNHALSILIQLEIPRAAIKRYSANTTAMIYHFYCYTNLTYIFFEVLKKAIAARFNIDVYDGTEEKGVRIIFSDQRLKDIKIHRTDLSSYLLDLYDDQDKLFSKRKNGARVDYTHKSNLNLYTLAWFAGKKTKKYLVDNLEIHYFLLQKELEIIFGHLNSL